jgi:acetyl esterase/lipase
MTQNAAQLSREQFETAREVPARRIPVPQTVSAELQKATALPLPDLYRLDPQTTEEWKSTIDTVTAAFAAPLQQTREVLRIRSIPKVVDGVNVFVITPEEIAPANRNRLLVHLPPGAYVALQGEAGTGEAILMAYYGKITVVSVDHRRALDHPFPAALEDAVVVWRDVVKTHDPANTGLFGSSAGGGLTVATVFRLKELNLPLPGAIAVGSPVADMTKTGDTQFTNEYIDNVLVSYDTFWGACYRLYARGHDLRDPLLSPVYGDFTGFPPATLISGTRDLFLSDTVRVHRKLREAGVEADLHVFEGQSHCQYLVPQTTTPEAEEAYGEIARFFERHLGRQTVQSTAASST